MKALNASEAGFATAEPMETIPVPDSETAVGELLTLSVNVNVAWRVPATVGTKSNVAVQLAPDASMVPQLWLVIEKSPGLAPDMAIPLMRIADVPPFVRVTVCALPGDPTATPSQEMLVGFTKTATTETQLVSGSRHKESNRAHTKSGPGLVLRAFA